jgi:hypothetical protein
MDCCDRAWSSTVLAASLAGVLLPSAITLVIHLWTRKEWRPFIVGWTLVSAGIIGGAVYAYNKHCDEWVKKYGCPGFLKK